VRRLKADGANDASSCDVIPRLRAIPRHVPRHAALKANRGARAGPQIGVLVRGAQDAGFGFGGGRRAVGGPVADGAAAKALGGEIGFVGLPVAGGIAAILIGRRR